MGNGFLSCANVITILHTEPSTAFLLSEHCAIPSLSSHTRRINILWDILCNCFIIKIKTVMGWKTIPSGNKGWGGGGVAFPPHHRRFSCFLTPISNMDKCFQLNVCLDYWSIIYFFACVACVNREGGRGGQKREGVFNFSLESTHPSRNSWEK